jgi:hypothetical protein
LGDRPFAQLPGYWNLQRIQAAAFAVTQLNRSIAPLNMKTISSLTVAAVLALFAGTAHAQLIGVQFVQQGPGLTPGEIAGFIPQDNYNLVQVNSGTGTNGTTGFLFDGSGDPTSITLTHSSNDGYNSNTDATTPNGDLLFGEDKSGGGGYGSGGITATYTFNDLSDGTYDLIGYIENENCGVTANITVGSTTYYVTDQRASGTPPFTLANNVDPSTRVTGNYVEFFNITAVNGQITLTNTSAGGGNGTAAINGLQLVKTVTSAVPEPSTYAMMLGGLALLGICIRRKGALPA